jgi:hypothetical protein
MTATRLWMIGCIAFAGLSASLALNEFGVGFNNYADTIHCNFSTAQRDVLFNLIPELRPPLQADQIVAAANAAKYPIIKRTAGLIQLTGGVEFEIQGTEISGVRSTNF